VNEEEEKTGREIQFEEEALLHVHLPEDESLRR
jgi:hypothetical protein